MIQFSFCSIQVISLCAVSIDYSQRHQDIYENMQTFPGLFYNLLIN